MSNKYYIVIVCGVCFLASLNFSCSKKNDEIVADTINIDNSARFILYRKKDTLRAADIIIGNKQYQYTLFPDGKISSYTERKSRKLLYEVSYYNSNLKCIKSERELKYPCAENKNAYELYKFDYDSCNNNYLPTSAYVSWSNVDTIGYNQNVEISIELHDNVKSDDVYFFTGCFDENYNIINSNKEIYKMSHKTLNYKLNSKTLGKNVLRGMILEKEYTKDSPVGIATYFVEITYYVKGSVFINDDDKVWSYLYQSIK